MVPAEVWKEVVEQGHNRPGALLVKQTDWIKVKTIEDKNLAGFRISERLYNTAIEIVGEI